MFLKNLAHSAWKLVYMMSFVAFSSKSHMESWGGSHVVRGEKVLALFRLMILQL